MKLIEKFMGAVITVVLIASLTGCSAKTQVQADTQTQEQLQAQSKVIEGYKSKLSQANRTIADDKIKIASKPKIIYKDKIIYKNDPITNKILYQTDLFLFEYGYTSLNGMEGDGCNTAHSDYNQEIIKGKTVLSPSQILEGITFYNKRHPNGEKY